MNGSGRIAYEECFCVWLCVWVGMIRNGGEDGGGSVILQARCWLAHVIR